MTVEPRTDERVPAQLHRRAPLAVMPSVLTPGSSVQRASGVALAVETIDHRTGARHRRLVVDDGHSRSPERPEVMAEFAEQDRLLRHHPLWQPPEVVDGRLVLHNDVSRWFYSSPAMREWRTQLVPRASALYPVQRPLEGHLPSGAPVDDLARRIFTDCFDSIGIRTRAGVLKEVVLRTSSRAETEVARPRWVSLACGAAVPVLDAVEVLDGTPFADPHLQLVDLDPEALRFARRLATERGLVEGRDFSLLHRDLITGVVARASLVDELGEGSATVVDAVGIFEYFRDAACVRLLRNAYRLLAPGGVLVVANMLSDRPELAMNQRGIGWPRLYPRSTDDLLHLVRRAGLPLHRTTVSIPQDGVYAVVDVTR